MTAKDKGHKVARPLSDDEVECLLVEALRQSGEFLPVTPEEVEQAEQELAKRPVELPEDLRDPLAILHGRVRPRKQKLGGPIDPNAAANLAQAARNGKEIPADVQELMKRDRDLAEQAQAHE